MFAASAWSGLPPAGKRARIFSAGVSCILPRIFSIELFRGVG